MTALWKSRPELGNKLALYAAQFLALHLGRTISRAVLRITAAYFLVRRTPERLASKDFLSRVLARPARLLETYQHFVQFSHVALDRFYLLTEKFSRFDIRCHGLAELDAALKMQQGVLLFGAHLGSFEALRVLSLQRPEVPIRILLDPHQGPMISHLLNSLNPAMAATIIDVQTKGVAATLAIQEALEKNAIVAMLVDRALPGEATHPVCFLGQQALLPIGPWLLAAAVKAPVVFACGLYHGNNRYDLHFKIFAPRIDIDRRQRHAQLGKVMQQFADLLTQYVRLTPYNWFNFYAFWHRSATVENSSAAESHRH